MPLRHHIILGLGMSFLDLDHSVKSLGAIFSSWPIGLLDFRVLLDSEGAPRREIAQGRGEISRRLPDRARGARAAKPGLR